MKPLLNKIKNHGILTIIIIVTVIVWNLYGVGVKNTLLKDKEESARVYGESVIISMNLLMEHYLYITEVMEHAYLHNEEAFLRRFESYGTWIVHNQDAVKTAYFTNGGVLSHGYPTELTARISHIDLFELETQKAKAIKARDSGKPIIAGPLTVLEGFKGLIVRNPVYREGEFAGFSIVVLDWDIFEKELIRSLTKLDKYKVAVRKEFSEEVELLEEGGYFFSTDEITDTRIEIPFVMANEQMYLVVDRHDNWITVKEMLWNMFPAAIIAVIVCLLAHVVDRSIYRSRQLEIERESNAAKSKFLSSMSHDMRTPLNGIIGLLDINLRHKNDHERVYENDSKAYSAATHLLALINNVLDMNKIASGEVEMEKVSFDIIQVINECCEMMQVQAAAQGIKVFLKREGEEQVYLKGSPLHLKEICLNLFSNAIKYNKKNGEIHAEMRCLSQTEEKIVYEFKLRDTGIGMSKEFMENHLYTPFVQGERADKINSLGTGLGMPIVKELVEKMNGNISVKSVVGEGTEFTVVLPFEISKEYQKMDVENLVRSDLEGMNVLLVDDVELNLEIVGFMLEEVKAKVTMARNGQEAVDIFKNSGENEFQLILMDVMMPVMDGYEATQIIRNLERKDAKTVTIVALTANAFKDDIERCIEAGMDGHIAKPVDMKLLMTQLQNLNM